MSAVVWKHCGHPATPENTRKIGKGREGCAKCRSEVDRRRREAKNAVNSANNISQEASE